MNKLKEIYLDAMQAAGYDLLTACENWQKFKEEIISLPAGEYTYHIKDTEITFKKVAPTIKAEGKE